MPKALLLLIFFFSFFISMASSSDVVKTAEVDSQEAQTIVESLQELFSILSWANKTYSYNSLFTYEANGYITTFKLNHWVEGNTATQRLMFMDGPKRHVLRHQPLSTCDKGETRWGIWPTALPSSALLEYSFSTVGLERIANRSAVVFDILPKDEYRYGYRYSVDRETGLVLKITTNHKQRIVERLQTVSMELLDSGYEILKDEDLDYLWRVPEIEPCQTEQFHSGWSVDWLPAGFEPVGNRVTTQGEQVLMFADGLASVSVFVINNVQDKLSDATGRHGATVAVISPMSTDSRRSIAVVGELPTATARKIATSVSPL